MAEEKQVQMPVALLNYSSLTQLLRNPLIFKVNQILGVYTGRKGVSSMIGSACHEALKVYYGGNPDISVPMDQTEAREIALSHGIQWIDKYPDAGIKFGKTGSREKILTGYATAMKIYFDEEPDYKNILICEEKMTGKFFTSDGQEFPLPGSGIPDLVIEDNGFIDVVDNKFVKTFTKKEDEDGEPNEDYIKIIQAMFLKHLLKSAKQKEIRRVIFREWKYSINKEGGSQTEDYVVDVNHGPYEIFFQNLYKDVVRFLSNPDAIFLPNLSDTFDGQEAGLLYTQGLITGDMSDVEVMHRVKEVAFTSKRFVPSRLDRAENENLAPEERVKLKLYEFGVVVQPEPTQVGGNVTQYRFKVSAGTSMARIKKYKDDIMQALAVKGELRILAPIPGTGLLGIEVENDVRTSEKLSKEHLVLDTLSLPIGTDVNGKVISIHLNEMPHILIAGATGSGKSVVIHNFLDALTKQNKPDRLKLTLIDPKRVELRAYAKKPHLHGEKVLYEYEDTVKALMGLAEIMDDRYILLEEFGVRDIAEYNKFVIDNNRAKSRILEYQVVVIDEFADFILRSKIEKKKWKSPSYNQKSSAWLSREVHKRHIKIPKVVDKDGLIDLLEADDLKNPLTHDEADIELLIVRLAQLGRAAGIHLVLATQRPSVDVITGLIKANFPTRIALTTASATDSNVIIGKPGAEKLAGKGDMLFVHPGLKGEVRLQGFNLSK